MDGIMPLRDRFMLARIELLANALLGLDAVLADQLPQLLQRHLHPLMKLWRIGRGAGGKGAFQVVDDGQQFADERFLFGARAYPCAVAR